MAHGGAGHRCGECRHLAPGEERARLRPELSGRNIPNARRCEKPHIPVGLPDSPNDPAGAAAGRIHHVKRGRARCKTTKRWPWATPKSYPT